MNVTFELFGVLRHVAGRKEVVVEVPEGSTIAEAVERLAILAGPDIGRYLISTEGTYTASFVVGGKRGSPADLVSAETSVKVLLAAGGG